MSFNAHQAAKQKAIKHLRKMVGDDLRVSDLDGMDAEKVVGLFGGIKAYAVHGDATNWFETSDPYKTSPLVNPYWELGGNRRDSHGNFPGSGDQRINDDNDKNTSGDSISDLDPEAKNNLINEMLGDITKDGKQYMVRVRIQEGQDPEKIKSELGNSAKYDGKSVCVIVDAFSEATGIQSKWPGAIIETLKGEGMR